MEQTFTTREHLEALIRATQGAYTASDDPAHHVVAGVFEACLVRFDFLYNQIDALKKENKQADDVFAEIIGSAFKLNFDLAQQVDNALAERKNLNVLIENLQNDRRLAWDKSESLREENRQLLQKLEAATIFEEFKIGDSVQICTFKHCAFNDKIGVIEVLNETIKTPNGINILKYGVRLNPNEGIYYFAAKELEKLKSFAVGDRVKVILPEERTSLSGKIATIRDDHGDCYSLEFDQRPGHKYTFDKHEIARV